MVDWHVRMEAASQAEWAVLQWDRVPLQALLKGRHVGAMKPEGFARIVRSLLDFSETTPGQGRFSNAVLKKLRGLEKQFDDTSGDA
jgi:hypothetical protein